MSETGGAHDLEAERAEGSHYCEIFDGLDDAIFIADPDTGILVDANRQAEVLLGRSRAEIIGMHQSQLHPTDAADKHRRAFQEQVKAGHFKADHDAEIVHKDGHVIPVSLSASLVTVGGRRLAVGVFRNISQRRQVEQEREAIALSQQRTEEALRENQRMLSTLMSNLPGMAFRCRNDSDWTMEFVSDGCLALTGYRPEDLQDSRLVAYGRIIHPDDQQAVWNQIQAALDEKRPYQIVYRIQTAGGQTKSVWEQGRAIYGPDGLAQSIEGFTTDITSRLEAEESLRQGEERYRQLVDLSPDAISIQYNGRLVFVNPAFTKLFGASRPDQLLGKDVLDLIHPNSRALVAERMRITRQERVPSPLIEQECLRLDGSAIHVEAMAIPLSYDGQPAVQVIARDITARKHAEEALRKSEERYRRLVELSPDAIYIHRQGRLEFINPAGLKLFGASQAGQILGKSMLELIHPDSREIVAQRIRAIHEGQTAVPLLAEKILRLDGTTANMEAAASPFEQDNGLAVLVIARDTEERIRAEQALRQQKELLQTIFDHIPVMIALFDPQGHLQLINRECEKVTGWSLEDVRDRDMPAMLWPDPAEQQRAKEFVQQGSSAWRDFRCTVRDGRIIDASGAYVRLSDGTLIGIGQDITARKQVQEALDESRRFTRRIIETNPNLIYIYDLQEQRNVYITPGISRILGYSQEGLQRYGQELMRQLLHPDDVAKVAEHHARCRQAGDGEVLEIDYRMQHASGRWVLLHSRDVPFSQDPDGTTRQIVGSSQDVTEQRQAEEALRASEERYRRLASNAQDMIYRLRLQPTLCFEYVSPAAKSILGYTPQECCSEDGFVIRTTHPDDREQVGEYMAGKVPFNKPFVVRVQRKDKRWVLLEVRNTPIHDEGGQMIALEGIARDISDRQRAEEAMLERTSLRELSHRILQSQEEERRRLSRELHDEAGQALTAIKLNTELLAKRVPDNLPALKRLAQDTSEVTASLISEMRRIAAALRPAVLDDLGLLPTLRWYAKSIEMRYGLRVKLISRGLKGRLNPSFETTVYRIVQEALTNVVRHAQAQHATVKVTCGKSGLHLLVQDDGKGMDLGRIRKGTGLTGIRERAHLYAGTMALESQPGVGTTLQVKFRNIPEAGS